MIEHLNCWFENVLLTYFGIEISKQNVGIVSREDIEHILNLHRSCPSQHHFYGVLGHERSEK
jgi:hypothetical protein